MRARFEVRDWDRYLEVSALKSHEVARFRYTKHISEAVPGKFDNAYFVVSSDVMRVITFPESLNGETGLICSYLGGPSDFSNLEVSEIIEAARAVVFLVRLCGSSR